VRIRYTKEFQLEYSKIIKRNLGLRSKIRKQITRMQVQINHPSLRLHKLSGGKYWSVSVDKSIRILVVIEGEIVYAYHIGKHEDVY